jgi:ribosomal protein S6--L-glutamate ligase
MSQTGQHGRARRAEAREETGATGEERPRVIAFVVEPRHLRDRAIREARTTLEERGCEVRLVAPGQDDLFDIPAEAPSWDAVVSRGRAPAVLALLSAAAAMGVFAVNPPRAIDLVRNKVAMQAILAGHGLPLPRAWYAADPAAFRRVPPGHYPLVVKPFDGDGSTGLAFLDGPDDVTLVLDPPGERPLHVAQEYLEADGWDLKLYGIGGHVWAVRKPAPFRFAGAGPALAQATDGAEPIPLDERLRDIALTCGRACGLELWGVDVAMTVDGPRVIEVNDFPTYSAVPEAGRRIAEHVLALTRLHALRRRTGQERMRTLVWSGG